MDQPVQEPTRAGELRHHSAHPSAASTRSEAGVRTPWHMHHASRRHAHALLHAGFEVRWVNRPRTLSGEQPLSLHTCFGFIVNRPGRKLLGLLKSQHWIALRKVSRAAHGLSHTILNHGAFVCWCGAVHDARGDLLLGLGQQAQPTCGMSGVPGWLPASGTNHNTPRSDLSLTTPRPSTSSPFSARMAQCYASYDQSRTVRKLQIRSL